MKSCYQTETQSIYEHGLLVWFYCQKLIGGNHEGMKIPKWFEDCMNHSLHSRDILEQYTIFHDLGKTRCLVVDEDGKRHFPNHAAISEQMWLEYGGCPVIGNLIGLDMIFHTESHDQIWSRNLSTETLCSLMTVALAELHANASMFGGITSESFCIKYKRLSKRAENILKRINSKSES